MGNLLGAKPSPHTKKENGFNNRCGFPEHKGGVLGITKARYKGFIGLSYISKKNPVLHSEAFRIGKKHCPFEFSAIQINKNLDNSSKELLNHINSLKTELKKCTEHKDNPEKCEKTFDAVTKLLEEIPESEFKNNRHLNELKMNSDLLTTR